MSADMTTPYEPQVGDRVRITGTNDQVYVVTGLPGDGNAQLGFPMPGPDVMLTVRLDQVAPADPPVKLSREYDPEQLDMAREARARTLANVTEINAACCCAYPLVSYRNVHGHDSGCPAVPILGKRRAQASRENQSARLRRGYTR